MGPRRFLVNGETTLGEKTLGHGVMVVRNIGHQGEILETNVRFTGPRGITHGTVIIVETVVHVALKWIEGETMTRGGTPVLVRGVRVKGGRDHLAVIAPIATIQSVSVEEWKRDADFLCVLNPRCITQRFDLYTTGQQNRVLTKDNLHCEAIYLAVPRPHGSTYMVQVYFSRLCDPSVPTLSIVSLLAEE